MMGRKKIANEKKHVSAVGDHHSYTWVDEADFENYELPNYENILMLTEKLQITMMVLEDCWKSRMHFMHLRC